MSVNGKTNDTFVATADMDDYQYHLVVNSVGGVSNRGFTAGGRVAGVSQNKPLSGENLTVTLLGKSRIKAGGTIVAGAGFTGTLSATAVAVGSGDYEAGFSVTGVASGGIFEGVITHAGVTIVA